MSVLSELENLMRAGRGQQVQKQLRRVDARKIPETDLAGLAALAWRSGAPELGLSWLHSRVRPPEKKRARDASVEQRAEYAACLLRLEAQKEAAQLLKGLPARTLPRIWLYRAQAEMANWDYRKAIPLLRAYLRSKTLSEYQVLVGKVNLASALIYESKHLEAKYLLNEVIHTAGLRKYFLLLANAYELSCANHLYQGKPSQAEPFLNRAQALLKTHSGIDVFYVEKWRAVLAFTRDGKVSHLEEIRRAARAGRYWESLRDCDRFELRSTRDETLFWRLYFGTPHPSYRERLKKELGWKLPPPDCVAWRLGKTSGKTQTLDFLVDGKALKAGQAMQRLVSALTSDFYRPLRVGPLFEKVFPGEYFNPISSTHRVHELVRRLRSWLRTMKSPLLVEESDGAYRLTGSVSVELLVPAGEKSVTKWFRIVRTLGAKFPSGHFRLAEASRVLGIPPMTLSRLLAQALKENALTREGKGRATRYRFSPKI